VIPVKDILTIHKTRSIKLKNQMKRLIPALLFVFYLSTGAWAQQTPSTQQKALQGVVIGLFDALAELDVDKAKSFCASDITILESGKVWNFDSLALRITTRKANAAGFKRINTLDFIETKVAGETACISYFNQAVISSSGKTVTVKWLESVVLTKSSKEWRISLLHSTELYRTP